jgi:16S rRNA U516 pseudouridylate synthase RsuA-like enzyme
VEFLVDGIEVRQRGRIETVRELEEEVLVSDQRFQDVEGRRREVRQLIEGVGLEARVVAVRYAR